MKRFLFLTIFLFAACETTRPNPYSSEGYTDSPPPVETPRGARIEDDGPRENPDFFGFLGWLCDEEKDYSLNLSY